MDTTTPPPIVQSPPPTEQPVRIGPIIRDVVIVWTLTAMGGFVAGVATGGPQRDPQRFMLAVAFSNFLLGSVAFTVVGCLAPPDRKSIRLNSSHTVISYAVFCLKKKKQ